MPKFLFDCLCNRLEILIFIFSSSFDLFLDFIVGWIIMHNSFIRTIMVSFISFMGTIECVFFFRRISDWWKIGDEEIKNDLLEIYVNSLNLSSMAKPLIKFPLYQQHIFQSTPNRTKMFTISHFMFGKFKNCEQTCEQQKSPQELNSIMVVIGLITSKL